MKKFGKNTYFFGKSDNYMIKVIKKEKLKNFWGI